MSSTPSINRYEYSSPDLANLQGTSGVSDISSLNIWGLLARAGGYGGISGDKAVQALIDDVIRSSKLQNAESMYSERNTAPGATSPATMPDTNPVPGDHRVINQGAYRGQGTLGNGSSTLSGAACALGSTTMIANRLTGSNTDLVQANSIAKNAGAFAPGSSDMSVTTAARSMGLSPAGGRMVANGENVDTAIGRMQRGNPPVAMFAGVDYKGGVGGAHDGETDHFVAVHSVSPDGTRLRASDPAGGKEIEFRRQGNNWVEVRPEQGAPYHGYTMTNFQLFQASNTAMASPPRTVRA